MKKLFSSIAIIVALVATSSNSYGQLMLYPLTKQDTIHKKDSTLAIKDSIITIPDSTTLKIGVYAGTLMGVITSVEQPRPGGFVNFRFGTYGIWQPTKWFAIKGMGTYHLDLKDPYGLLGFSFRFTPVKPLAIEFGYMGTLVTEQRPYPPTRGSHFETHTEGQAVGSTYNIKIVATGINDFSFGGCLAYRNDALEYQAMFGYKWLKISGWYNGDKYGSIMTLDFSRVYNVTTWNQDQICNFICVKFGKNKDYQIYSDNGYNWKTKSLARSETGFLKTFDVKLGKVSMGGLFGAGYQHETRTANLYWFWTL